MRARLSFCTRSTAASAVRPVSTASRSRFTQPLVMGEHADGFEHFGILGAAQRVGAIDHLIDMRAQLLHRILKPLLFLRNAFGDEIVDDDARLMQHRMAKRHAFGQRLRRLR